MERQEIFITGYAKLPQGMPASELYSTIAVGLVVDAETGEILDVDCSLVTQVARDFVGKLVRGKNLNALDEIEAAFNSRYFGSARKCLISAVRTCAERYRQMKSGVEQMD